MYVIIMSLYYSIKRLDKLEKLIISENEMRSLPSVIADLHNLRELDVEYCGLTSLPDR